MKRLAKVYGTVLLCLFIPICHASSQPAADSPRLPNDSVPFAPLLHPSHFLVKWPEGALYEGDINLPVHLWSRTASLKHPDRVEAAKYDCFPGGIANAFRKVEQALLGSRGVKRLRTTGCTLTFVPHFVLRQIESGSAPVRTPTFNPALEWTRFALFLEDAGTVERRDSAGGGAWRKATLGALHLRFGHYSNGQSGCLYTNQALDTCAVIPGEVERLNTLDGDFSTHYFEPAVTYARLRFDSTGHERQLSSLTLALRHNFRGWDDYGGMSDDLARTYGRNSVSASYVMRWRSDRFPLLRERTVANLILDGECALERPKPYEACRASAGLSLSFPGMYGFGFGTRYLWGWDYYNVGYGNRIRNWGRRWPTLGIVLDHTIPIVIRR